MITNSNYKSWLLGIPYEVAFWNNLYRWDDTFEGLCSWSRRGKELILEGMDAQQFLSGFSEPTVLDVGCGLSFAKGDKLLTDEGLKQLNVRYIDPLASFYNRIKKQYRRDVPDVEFGMMENLSTIVTPGSVQLVIFHNALDHSASPLKGILSALNVLQVGGCLYLNHHPNEAQTERYKGFHQYNICSNDARKCLIWNKDTSIVVDDVVAPFATVETQVLSNGFVVSVIKKFAEIPTELVPTQREVYELAQLFSSQLFTQFDLSVALKMKFSYWWYNTIQFFVQFMSYENRMRLRKLVYRK